MELESIFGQDYTWISRVFDIFVIWIHHHFKYLLFNNLDYWANHFTNLAEKIRLKAIEIAQSWEEEIDFWHENKFLVALFTDATNQYIRRTGAGPANDGLGAPRGDPDGWLQRVYYCCAYYICFTLFVKLKQ